MIQLYTWGTPNGKKVSIMLEEIGLPYEVHAINIGQGDQFKPEYLAINPNNKIPSIIDPDGPDGKPFTLFESGAILMYLAEKSGKLWPADLRQRFSRPEWLSPRLVVKAVAGPAPAPRPAGCGILSSSRNWHLPSY